MHPLDSFHVVGDRVLIRPDRGETRTDAGLILPAGVRAKDAVEGGRVVKVGPGHLMANPEYSDAEPWAPARDAVRYLPLQALPGDYALFLRNDAIEIEYDSETLSHPPTRIASGARSPYSS